MSDTANVNISESGAAGLTSEFSVMSRADLVTRLEAVKALADAAYAGHTYVLPGGYPSRPVEAFDLCGVLK